MALHLELLVNLVDHLLLLQSKGCPGCGQLSQQSLVVHLLGLRHLLVDCLLLLRELRHDYLNVLRGDGYR